MEEKEIEEFLKTNEISIKILEYISNTHLLSKLIDGKNSNGVSTANIIKKFPELKILDNPNDHIRVLVRMGLLKYARWDDGKRTTRGRPLKKTKRRLKKMTEETWTIPEGIARIIKKITDNS
jgi:hypothetical protein